MSNTALQNILGSDAIGSSTTFLDDLKAGLPLSTSVGSLAPLGVGAAAGGYLWKRHRVLGALVGGMAGANAMALFDSSTRRNALCNIGQVTSGAMAAKAMRGRPVIGFLLGWLGSGAVIHFTGLRG